MLRYVTGHTAEKIAVCQMSNVFIKRHETKYMYAFFNILTYDILHQTLFMYLFITDNSLFMHIFFSWSTLIKTIKYIYLCLSVT